MIGLIYLAWVPLGPEPVREFLRSYGAHGAGAGHELVVVLNGGVPGGPNAGGTEKSTGEHADPAAGSRARMALLAELRETEHRLVELEAPVLDLPAYASYLSGEIRDLTLGDRAIEEALAGLPAPA